MSLKRLDILGDEPLDLDTVKAYLRVDGDHDDGLIETLMSTARSTIEAYTSRALIPQLWEFSINAGFAVARSDEGYLSQAKSRGDLGIELPRSPFVELRGAPILETEYGQKELSDYRIDTSGRAAKVHFGASAQKLMEGTGRIVITFQAGYQSHEFPDAIKQAMLMIIAQLYDHRSVANDNPGLVGEFDQNISMLLRPYQIKRLA